MKNLLYLLFSLFIISCSTDQPSVSVTAHSLQAPPLGISFSNFSEVAIKKQINPSKQNASAHTIKGIKVRTFPDRKAKDIQSINLNLIQPKLLKRDSLLNDIDLLEQALTKLHPGIYRYNTPAQVKVLFKDFREQLPKSITETEFMKRLAQLIVNVRCGHTYVNPWNMDAALRKRLYGNQQYFPIGFTVVNGRFFTTENASENAAIKRGAEILSINQIPISNIYDNLKTIAKSDGNNFNPTDYYLSLSHYEARYWNAFDVYFPLFFPLKSTNYTFSYRNPDDNTTKHITVKALTKKQRADAMKAKYGEAILEKSGWKINIINDDLAVIKLGTFATWNWKDFDHEQWYAKAFKQLDSLHIPNLAIDIRGNGGGLSEPKNELICYLISKELKCKDQGKVLIKTTKLDKSLLPYIETWAKPLIAGLPEEMYRKIDEEHYQLLEPSNCVDILPKATPYKGKVFILGDASNVSATFTLLDQAKTHHFATFVGQPSGGNKQGINGGEYAFFQMPYSKMEVDIPLKFFAPNQARKDEGISPKYLINVTQEDIATNRDPYLAFIKEMIK